MLSTNSSSSPSKKRKANDGTSCSATDGAHDVSTGNTNDGGGFLSSWFGYFSGRSDGATSGLRPPAHENNTTQLNRMEQMMIRMEGKLATVGNLERRCEELERKCSSLENMLESTKEHIDKKFEHIDKKFESLHSDLDRKGDSLADRLEAKVDAVHKVEADKALKRHEFNEMMLKNQSWKYSVPSFSRYELSHDGFTDEAIEYLTEAAKELRDCTTKMRRGEFTSYIGDSGVHVSITESYPRFSFAVNKELLPHWKEFAAALEQFTPAINLLPDDSESSFTFYCVQLNYDVMLMIKNALVGKPFQNLHFANNGNDGDDRGMSVAIILDVVESNKHLRKLEIFGHEIGNQHIERICSAVRNYRLVELDLCRGFDSGDGDEMLASLLTIDDLALEKLNMTSNNITSTVSTLLADFLATNPRLKELYLQSNDLNDSDAVLIANALRSNTTLRRLDLDNNEITDAGVEALRRILWDDSSLNAAADTNHCCKIDMGRDSSSPDYAPILNKWNSHEEKRINRGKKIYHLLSSRHKTMSNAKYFENIDVKNLPNLLAAVQKYYDASTEFDLTNDMYTQDPKVKPLSVVYEVIRKWDKVFPLYKSLGLESIEN